MIECLHVSFDDAELFKEFVLSFDAAKLFIEFVLLQTLIGNNLFHAL